MGLFDYPGTAHKPENTLNEITLLADLSEQGWARVLTHVETRQFKSGENLITTGDDDRSFYILTHGQVDVIFGNTDQETVLATIHEGSVFGEISFFDGAPRSATVKAKTSGSAVRITRQDFDNLAAWEPLIARQLLYDLGRILAMRLRWTTQKNSK